ncbi:hypothetical protein D3C85_1765760 [compost metagenome]
MRVAPLSTAEAGRRMPLLVEHRELHGRLEVAGGGFFFVFAVWYQIYRLKLHLLFLLSKNIYIAVGKKRLPVDTDVFPTIPPPIR